MEILSVGTSRITYFTDRTLTGLEDDELLVLPGVGDILRLLFLVGWSGVDIDDDGVRWR